MTTTIIVVCWGTAADTMDEPTTSGMVSKSERITDEWNRRYPVGTPVRYCGEISVTDGVAVSGPCGGTPTVSIAGKRVALTNIAPQRPVRETFFAGVSDPLTAEEREFLDLSRKMYRHSRGTTFDEAMRTFPSGEFHRWCNLGSQI